MSVIVELTLPADEFELGRVLTVEGDTRITLETMVPLGESPAPFVRVRNSERTAFEEAVRNHSSVESIHHVNTHEDESLYALEWKPSEESLVRTIMDMGAALLRGSGSANSWGLELRFPTHDALSDFQEYYVDRGIQVTIDRIFNPTKPDAGPWYGLTGPQRETLMYAVQEGYYSLPRGISTQELGEAFDISDQAATERLRRGLTTLVNNTLLAVEEDH